MDTCLLDRRVLSKVSMKKEKEVVGGNWVVYILDVSAG